MKAFIDRDTLVKIIRDHTVFTTAVDIPKDWQWYQLKEGLLTWDFMLQGKVLVDVEVPIDADVSPPHEWFQSFEVKRLKEKVTELETAICRLSNVPDKLLREKISEEMPKIAMQSLVRPEGGKR